MGTPAPCLSWRRAAVAVTSLRDALAGTARGTVVGVWRGCGGKAVRFAPFPGQPLVVPDEGEPGGEAEVLVLLQQAVDGEKSRAAYGHGYLVHGLRWAAQPLVVPQDVFDNHLVLKHRLPIATTHRALKAHSQQEH